MAHTILYVSLSLSLFFEPGKTKKLLFKFEFCFISLSFRNFFGDNTRIHVYMFPARRKMTRANN